MSVQNQTVKNVYAGNGSTTVFPYTFALNVADGEYVDVYVTDDEGVSEPTTNFLIDTNAQTVTFPKVGDPLEAGRKIVILRQIPNEQELNLINEGPYFAEDIEGALDRIVMMIQQIQEAIDRAVKVDLKDDLPSASVIYDINHVREYKEEAVASASAAATSATASANSATASANSATNSANSATASANSASSSAGYATNSANSASAAATSATNSANSATSAGNSATSASTSATNAANSATAAETSATNAAASATSASTSATNAANSASAASTSKNSAAGSATAAATSAGNAADSATAAATSETNAAASALTAEQYASQVEGFEAALAWDETETYNYPDVVAYTDGFTYRCVGTNVGGTEVPGSSIYWVSMMYGIGAFDLDANHDLMPAATMIGDDDWDYDANGDLMPKAAV